MASSNSVKQHKLRKVIARLSDEKGRGLEFISLYIPQETPIDEVVAFLKKELDSTDTKSQSDKEVKDRLQDALKNLIQHLKLKKEMQETGLAIFAGTFPDKSDNETLSLEEVIPPEPIPRFLYEVDDHFRLEPLRDMLRNQKVVGLIALDSKEAAFGISKDECLEILQNITSGISGKTSKGGSSQRRYERERDMAVTNFFHRIAEHAAKAFLEDHKVTALIVGGPGTTKEDFLKGDYLNYELRNSLLSPVDTQSAGKEGVKETLDKSAEERQNMCAPDEKRIMQRLLTAIGKQDNLAIYGLDPVLTALKAGEVDVALLTDSTEMFEVSAVCKRCSLSKTRIVSTPLKVQVVQEMISTPCQRCNSVEYEVAEKDMVDVLEDAASQTGASVEVISTESEEKNKLTAFGGFAALLRYNPK